MKEGPKKLKNVLDYFSDRNVVRGADCSGMFIELQENLKAVCFHRSEFLIKILRLSNGSS